MYTFAENTRLPELEGMLETSTPVVLKLQPVALEYCVSQPLRVSGSQAPRGS